MRFGITAATAALLLSACGGREPEEPPVLIEAAQVKPLLYWSADLAGRRVMVDGYVDLDNGPTGDAIAMRPRLTSRPRGLGDALVSFEVERGTGPGQLNLPVVETRGFTNLPAAGEVVIVDLRNARFQDSTGASYPLTEKVRVTGRVAYRSLSGQPMGTEDDRSPSGRRFDPRLTDVTLEVAP